MNKNGKGRKKYRENCRKKGKKEEG
jgi:hypothetical protein